MDNLELRINEILGEWNPIGVDKNIAQSEYTRYIPKIIKSMKDRQTLFDCLQQILDRMGANFDSNDIRHTNDLSEICSKLFALNRRAN